MYTYTHHRKVAYHETDKMGITHHANYVKFLEEARVGYLESIGLPFQLFESRGVTSPVVGIQIEYHHPSTFGDELLIAVVVTKYTGVRYEVAYEITQASDGAQVAVASSKHCFLAESKVVSLKKACPDLHETFSRRIAEA
ncbi:YbgC/FadM family acyl-CoA thioesterase [Eggerthellaceae bacterium zg-893]|nr:YbgC/FadM family acyl-CoA thioesterase [Eggerthellaceae bacterium zg-893]